MNSAPHATYVARLLIFLPIANPTDMIALNDVLHRMAEQIHEAYPYSEFVLTNGPHILIRVAGSYPMNTGQKDEVRHYVTGIIMDVVNSNEWWTG